MVCQLCFFLQFSSIRRKTAHHLHRQNTHNNYWQASRPSKSVDLDVLMKRLLLFSFLLLVPSSRMGPLLGCALMPILMFGIWKWLLCVLNCCLKIHIFLIFPRSSRDCAAAARSLTLSNALLFFAKKKKKRTNNSTKNNELYRIMVYRI